MSKVRILVGVAAFLGLVRLAPGVGARTIRVPEDEKTIQAGIDTAEAGDIVLVSAGTYRERLRMKEGVTVRSAGDDTQGKLGLERAEQTIIDGSFSGARGPGVEMAESSVLDGFSVTGVGEYDDSRWRMHHATHGEEQSHEHIGAPGTAGISVSGVARCTVANNIVHHIGYTGIAIVGAEAKRVSPMVLRNISYRNMGGGIGSMRGSTAIIEGNVCFENFYAGIGHSGASPLVTGNVCHGNIRAGIGISEGSRPIVRDNKCYGNRRAGIGIRAGSETQPVVENNECYENDMAGIGSRDDARPIIRQNRCYKNRLAGIGSRDRARPLIVDNECFENETAGIGSRGGAAPIIHGNRCYRNETAGIGSRGGARPLIVENESRENDSAGIGIRGEDTVAVIVGNRCVDNRLVAIGLPDGATGFIHGNELARTGGGAPPLVAVRGESRAVIAHNQIRGGGVAAVLVQGQVSVLGNRFEGRGPGQGPAVRVWKGSMVTLDNNRCDGYRNLVLASESRVTATGNVTRSFQGVAIVVKKPASPAHVHGNVAISSNAGDRAVEIEGAPGAGESNALKKPDEVGASENADTPVWPGL